MSSPRLRSWSIVAVGPLALLIAGVALAGHGNLFRQNQVGGISIDAQGVVAQPIAKEAELYRKAMAEFVRPAPAQLNTPTELRKVSLKAVEAALAEQRRNPQAELPEELRYLAGIQRIKYVLVYPEQNDIVLAGPGEGWRIDQHGNVVGVTTGRPVLRIDDLVTSLRIADNARREGVSVSIEPTAEGRRNLQAFLATQRTFTPQVLAGAERAMGQQQVLLTGVPGDTRFARVLVAADYRMKRIGMNLDPSPVRALPGYLDLLRSANVTPQNATPRWWLACNYEPLARSEDGLAYELRGPGVKCMAEEDFVADDGRAQGTGRANPLAQKWADLMTQHYDALCGQEPVFGDLRNLMDMSVIAALIQKEDLLGRAGMSLPVMLDRQANLGFLTWHAPKSVATQCSFIKVGRNYVITASGGVQIESWQAASQTSVDAAVGAVRQQAAPTASSLWWN